MEDRKAKPHKKSALSSFFSSAIAFFTISPEALSTSVEKGQADKVRALIKNGYGVNFFYNGSTPLFLSLLKNKYEITLLLLELGADPNARYEYEIIRGKILTAVVSWHRKSDAKLLAFYGANSKDVDFTDHPEYQELVETTFKKFLQRKTLEQQLAVSVRKGDHTDCVHIYGQLSELWASLAENESQSIYRQHYIDKAVEYQKQARAEQSLSEVELQSAAEGSDSSHGDEQSGLIRRGMRLSSSEIE